MVALLSKKNALRKGKQQQIRNIRTISQGDRPVPNPPLNQEIYRCSNRHGHICYPRGSSFFGFYDTAFPAVCQEDLKEILLYLKFKNKQKCRLTLTPFCLNHKLFG